MLSSRFHQKTLPITQSCDVYFWRHQYLAGFSVGFRMIYIWYISVGVKQWVLVLWTWQERALTVVSLSEPQISRPDYPYPTHCDTPPYHSIIKLNRAVPRHASLRIVDPVERFEYSGIDISERDGLWEERLVHSWVREGILHYPVLHFYQFATSA